MFEVEIDGKKAKAEVSFYTALLYEQEFHRDMISDFYGVQDTTPMVSMDGAEVARIDFTKVSWLAVTRVLWAACKTADESTPPYTAWMKGTRRVDTWTVRVQIDDALSDCFFRSGDAVQEAPEGEGRRG